MVKSYDQNIFNATPRAGSCRTMFDDSGIGRSLSVLIPLPSMGLGGMVDPI